jgi:chromate reductase, NAD(P)H dehydrogenase (quinone)
MLCGSLRAGSTNHAVLATAALLLPQDAASLTYGDMASLPHFNPDDDHEPLAPPVTRLRSHLDAADAVLICTPEYAGALPGSFKNLLDWTIGGAQIYGKPVAWINAAGPAAPTGGADAHESLRKVLGYAGADIVDPACIRIPVLRSHVGDDGLIDDPAIRARIAEAVSALARRVTAA